MIQSLLILACLIFVAASHGPSVADYPTIQEAIRANPGRMVHVPAGDYDISEKIHIGKEGGGLFGPGRIRQINPNQPILVIEDATDVQVRDLRLLRPEGKTDTDHEGVLAIRCRNLVLENLQVLDNRTRAAAITLRECRGSQIRGCRVQNYMRISVDDRTSSADWGYAFRCIDGTGIAVSYSQGTLIHGNRIVEEHLLPTPEIQKKFDLGKFVKKNPQKGIITSQKTWDTEFAQNWHQGSAIIVTAPEVSDSTQILGNYIENAAQGIDLHSDHVIVAQNIIVNSHIGLKAMHGSRHILIIGNQFSKNDLWSIGLMPGAASRAVVNTDGGSIIAHNLISDFGYGPSRWMWGTNVAPLRFNRGQKPDNPPLTDVLIQGNIVYDTARDRNEPPRYRYAVIIESGANGPKGLHFTGNLFHPGTDGISNVELPP